MLDNIAKDYAIELAPQRQISRVFKIPGDIMVESIIEIFSGQQIDSRHMAAFLPDAMGQRTVATAYIQYSLAGLDILENELVRAVRKIFQRIDNR